MIRKQALIAAGMALAAFVVILIVPRGVAVLPPVQVEGTADRLAFALRWCLAPVLTLFAGIGFVSAVRFFSDDGIDGHHAPTGRLLDVALRYNRNTLEQTLLAVIAWLGLALANPPVDLRLIPVLATVFALGRALFWLGYLAAPWARALGFGLTFYPTATALIWLGWRAAQTWMH